MGTHLLNKLRRFSRLSKKNPARRGWGLMENLEGRTLLSGVDFQTPDVELQAPDDQAYLQILRAAASATPTVTIKATDATAAETAGKPNRGYFTFTRAGATSGALTVKYAIAGTAKNGVDYQTIANSIIIPAGKASASIPVNVINDTRIEKTESIRLTLATDAAYTIGATSQASVGIVDNDGPVVTVSASIAQGTELSSGGGRFTLERTGSTALPLTVYYTLRGTAKNAVDYKQLTGVATFKAGKKTIQVYVTPIDDLRVEPNETVTMRLYNDYYVIGGTGAATVTITDNDYAANDSPGGLTFVGPPGNNGDSYLFFVATETDPNVNPTPTNLSKSLDSFSAGHDYGINMSPNGQWLVLHSDRFGGQNRIGSLVVVPKSNMGAGQQIKVGGNTIVPAATSNSAIGNDGLVVVYASADGPHTLDLWSVSYTGAAWVTELLTGDSTYAYNMQPALSADGTTVVFAAGDTSAASGEAIAEVNLNASGFQTLVTGQGQVSHPDYGLNGQIVFGSDQGGDRIWRRSNLGALSLISGALDEFAPAVLPDGRIASLWWDQAANPDGAVYELTIRSAVGAHERTILPDASFPIITLGVGA
jgi:hypothetical protein